LATESSKNITLIGTETLFLAFRPYMISPGKHQDSGNFVFEKKGGSILYRTGFLHLTSPTTRAPPHPMG
jgi:hypothetical protein